MFKAKEMKSVVHKVESTRANGKRKEGANHRGQLCMKRMERYTNDWKNLSEQ